MSKALDQSFGRTKTMKNDRHKVYEKISTVFEKPTGEILKSREIKRLVSEAYPGTNEGSVIPTDHCYNMINKDPHSFTLRLFEACGGAKFKCLGLNAQYTGPIYRYFEKQNQEKVGEWIDGQFTLWSDPRKQ